MTRKYIQIKEYHRIWHFIKKLFKAWHEHRIPSLSAALAYYMLFSLAPILLICIYFAGLFFTPDIAQSQVLNQIQDIIGPNEIPQIRMMLEYSQSYTMTLTSVLGFMVLIFGASGIFNEIQRGLNAIWGVKNVAHQSFMGIVKSRFLSFSMVLSMAILFLISALLTPMLTFIKGYYFFAPELINDAFYCFIATIIFIVLFKILPDVKLKWQDVCVGAFITAIMLTVGRFFLSFYLSHTHIVTAFGASGALIAILIWIYYSAQIFFIGAEITRLMIIQKGKLVVPARHAVRIEKKK